MLVLVSVTEAEDGPEGPIAVMVACADDGILFGALYMPWPSIEPWSVVQEVAPAAENCFVPPSGTTAAAGETPPPNVTGNGAPIVPFGFATSIVPTPAVACWPVTLSVVEFTKTVGSLTMPLKAVDPGTKPDPLMVAEKEPTGIGFGLTARIVGAVATIVTFAIPHCVEVAATIATGEAGTVAGAV